MLKNKIPVRGRKPGIYVVQRFEILDVEKQNPRKGTETQVALSSHHTF